MLCRVANSFLSTTAQSKTRKPWNMSNEGKDKERRDQDPKPWCPTPEEFEKLKSWARKIGGPPQRLYEERREPWLQELVRAPKDLARLAPFMKQMFLQQFAKFPIARPDVLPFRLITLLQHYVEAQPMDKALINFVPGVLTDATMRELVGHALAKDPDSRFWLELAIEFEMRWFLTDLSNMSNTTRALLKRLHPDPEDAWGWDELQRDWELILRDRQQDVNCGFVSIAPIKDGEEFHYEDPPEPWHNEWALRFSVHLTDTWDQIPTELFLVRATLSEVKRQLDLLLGADTPQI